MTSKTQNDFDDIQKTRLAAKRTPCAEAQEEHRKTTKRTMENETELNTEMKCLRLTLFFFHFLISVMLSFVFSNQKAVLIDLAVGMDF